MTSEFTDHANPVKRRQEVPWALIFLLWVLFFIATSDLFFSLAMEENTWREETVSDVVEGHLTRRLSFLAIGLIGALQVLRYGRERLQVRGMLGWLIVLLVAWSFFSLVWAQDYSLTFRRLIVFSMMGIAALAVLVRCSPRGVMITVFSCSGAFLFLGILAETALGTLHPFAFEYRFSGTFHPNIQGMIVAILILSGLGIAENRERGRWLLLAVVFVGLIFLILTKSRTAFGSTILAVFAYKSLMSAAPRKRLFVIGVLLTVAVVALFVGEAFFPVLQESVLLGRDFDAAEPLSGRVSIWIECLEYVKARPLLGYGYQGFWTPDRIDEISFTQGWVVSGGHSTYLAQLLNLGVVGFVLFVLILVMGGRSALTGLRVSGDPAYGFFFSLIVLCALDGVLETVPISPGFVGFCLIVVLGGLGFRRRDEGLGRIQGWV